MGGARESATAPDASGGGDWAGVASEIEEEPTARSEWGRASGGGAAQRTRDSGRATWIAASQVRARALLGPLAWARARGGPARVQQVHRVPWGGRAASDSSQIRSRFLVRPSWRQQRGGPERVMAEKVLGGGDGAGTADGVMLWVQR